jgi:hypothetical protein
MECSLENGLDLLKQHWQILGLFHFMSHYIVYNARINVIKMQYRVNFLLDGLYSIAIWREKSRILKSVIYDVHTPNNTKIRQKKKKKKFQILITYLNANEPTA